MSDPKLSEADRAALYQLPIILDKIAERQPETPMSGEESYSLDNSSLIKLGAERVDGGIRVDIRIDPKRYGQSAEELLESTLYDEVIDMVVAAASAAAEVHDWTKYFEHYEVARESENFDCKQLARDGVAWIEVHLSLSSIPSVNESLELDKSVTRDEGMKNKSGPESNLNFNEMSTQALGKYADASPDDERAAAELMARELNASPRIRGVERRHGNQVVFVQPEGGPSLGRFSEDYCFNLYRVASVEATKMKLPNFEKDGKIVVILNVQGLRGDATGRARPDLKSR